jgi:penicillin-binding protein 2
VKKDKYLHRQHFFTVLFILIWIALGARLLSIQILNDKYKKSAAVISIREEIVIPARGVIRDRHGEELVVNYPVYDLMVVPNEVEPFDTLTLCRILGLDLERVRNYLQEHMRDPYLRVNRSVLARQLPLDRMGTFTEFQFRFPGFYVQERTMRRYPMSIASHTLGYIGEVNQHTIETDSYYISGDYIGISGIEKSYEKFLRGNKGLRKRLKDKFGRDQGPYLAGRDDVEAQAGMDLFTTMDARLQEYGELLMQNKVGSVVAIEPSTGEILALVTSPTYDPNLFSGRERAMNYRLLLNDKNKPLMNRALQAQYPPGSTFKMVNALIAMQMGSLKAETRYGCGGGFAMGRHTVRCHGHPGPTNVAQSIQYSCNTYYCYSFRDMLDRGNYPSTRAAFEVWRDHAMSFGLGQRFENDLPFGYTGNIPTAEYFDRFHGRGRWRALTVISLAIGQGEILTTPMQLANIAVVIANRGHFFNPHIVKAIGHSDSLNLAVRKRFESTINPAHFEPIIRGMRDVVLAGTARNAHIENIAVCGKTGTAQNPHGDNHSLFLAYAPMENPKIAIAVIVENAGYGSTWASPIASLMIEQYLTGEVKRTEMENRIIKGNLMKR